MNGQNGHDQSATSGASEPQIRAGLRGAHNQNSAANPTRTGRAGAGTLRSTAEPSAADTAEGA